VCSIIDSEGMLLYDVKVNDSDEQESNSYDNKKYIDDSEQEVTVMIFKDLDSYGGVELPPHNGGCRRFCYEQQHHPTRWRKARRDKVMVMIVLMMMMVQQTARETMKCQEKGFSEQQQQERLARSNSITCEDQMWQQSMTVIVEWNLTYSRGGGVRDGVKV
jgi:hypothetical protein